MEPIGRELMYTEPGVGVVVEHVQSGSLADILVIGLVGREDDNWQEHAQLVGWRKMGSRKG